MGNKQPLKSSNLVVLLQLGDDKKFKAAVDAKLKEETFDINSKINQFGDTLLHYAAFRGSESMVKYLLQHQADPHQQNDRKLSPMDIAKERGMKSIINLLEKPFPRNDERRGTGKNRY
eukprot:TRINITY_DN3995_c0_g2_i3.p1 TRINITY_DN3995_c0_g2~~TRINITY_DN3995_c0_g2_i3.p1  ORF type:complete len:118 (-),score=26.88 TRINITY_DN3995_c0_g2_i3:57-410(-)